MRRLLLCCCLLASLAGCEEDKSANALKNTGGVVSREDDRTTLKYFQTKETDAKLKRMNFQLAGTFIRIGHIELNDCDVSDRGIEELTRIKNLEILHIIKCPNIANKSMMLLPQNPDLVDLVILHTRADDDAYEGIDELQKLESLQISGIAAKTLNQISRLKSLERMVLIDSKINESGARALGRMVNLKTLSFHRCEMRENIETQVRRSLPQTRIVIHRDAK